MEKKKEGAHTTIPRTHVHISPLFPISRRRERNYFPLCRRSLRERVRPSFRRYDFLPLLPPSTVCRSVSRSRTQERRRRKKRRKRSNMLSPIVPRGREGEEGEKPSVLLFPPPFPPPSLPLSICGARRISQPYFSSSPPLDPCTMYILGQLPHSTFVSVQKDPVLFLLLSPSHLCSLCILARQEYYLKQSFLTPSNHSCYQPQCHMYLSTKNP